MFYYSKYIFFSFSVNACDIRTNTKVAVFINPPLNRESSGLECSYNIEINNNNVCQMKIEFETFNLAPPTTVSLSYYFYMLCLV